MSQLMNDIMETAKSFAENFSDKGNFDYSVNSLEEVDELLEEMSDYIIDDETMYNIYTMVGSYVFETARRNVVANSSYYWIQEEEQPILVVGEPDFSVAIKAWEKVKSRLENGVEDNIPFYIEGFMVHIEQEKKQKGYTSVVV